MGHSDMGLEAPCPHAAMAIPQLNRWMLDPLDCGGDDEMVELTLRQIVRVTLVATEVGARFQREGIGTDPMAWMLAPRKAFDGLAPVEACITRSHCARAVLIHGLGLDLDIEPDALDELMEDDPADDGGHLEVTE